MLKQGIQLMSRTFDGILNLVNFCAQFKNIIQSRSIVLFYFISLKNLKSWLEEKLRKEIARQLEAKLGSFFLSSHGRVQKLLLTFGIHLMDMVIILLSSWC